MQETLVHGNGTRTVLSELDTELFYLVNRGLANPAWDRLVPLLGRTLEYGTLILITDLVTGPEYAEMVLLLTMLAGFLLSEKILKPFFGRDRPYETLPDARLLIPRLSSASFPSSHALVSFACAETLGRLYPRHSAAFYALAGGIAFSRVYTGVHYPADVLAGGILGYYLGTITGGILL